MKIKTLVVLISAVVLSATGAMAQYGSYDNQGASHHGDGKVSVVGCVAGAGENYTLTDRWGTVYQLIGNPKELSSHVGQTVRVSGISLAGQTPASMSEDMERQPTLSVTSFRHVSSHCGVTKGSGAP